MNFAIESLLVFLSDFLIHQRGSLFFMMINLQCFNINFPLFLLNSYFYYLLYLIWTYYFLFISISLKFSWLNIALMVIFFEIVLLKIFYYLFKYSFYKLRCCFGLFQSVFHFYGPVFIFILLLFEFSGWKLLCILSISIMSIHAILKSTILMIQFTSIVTDF